MTLEIPDAIFRRAKSKAAERGIPLRQFVTEAVEDKLETSSVPGKQPWMKLAGELKHLPKESARVKKIIEEEFEQIEPEMWKHEPRCLSPIAVPRIKRFDR
ncbi:MAG TPA: hypothetical protein VE545_10095 [Candidatus Dormibacteraeota bacterium]|nr:hypothetical protein [Candidatus Dormibacteraeota bacterium]